MIPRSGVIAFVVALAGLAVALQAFRVFPVTGGALLRLGAYGLGAVLIAGSLVGWGGWLASFFGLPTRDESAFGLGLALLGVAVGAFSWLAVPGAIVSAGLFGLGWVWLWLGRDSLNKGQLAAPLAVWTPSAVGAVLFLVPPLFLALAPAISLDSLVYHLAVPRQYLLHGRAFEMPWSVHSGFVRLVETLFGMTLELDPWGVMAQLFSWSLAVATLLALARVGGKLFGGQSGGWAALLLISLPALNVVAGWAWTDWAVLLFTVLAIEAWSRFREQQSLELQIAVGVFVGAAVAAKYTALPLLALPVLCLLDGARLKHTGLAVGAALLPGLPWTVHNLWIHHNPIFPLFTEAAQGMGQYRGEAGLLERVQGYFGRPDLLDESLGLILFPALVLGLLLRVAPWDRYRTLYCQAFACLAAGLLLHPTVRSFAPVLVLASLLGGAALARFFSSAPSAAGRRTRRAWGLVVAVALLANGVQIAWIFQEYAPISSALGFESEEEYLLTGQDYYRAFKLIEENTEPSDGVLVVGESRVFHLNRPTIAASYLDPHPLHAFRQGGCEGDCLLRALRDRGIRVVLVNKKGYRLGGASEREPTTNELEFFVSREDDKAFRSLLEMSAQQVKVLGSFTIYKLLESPRRARDT